MAPLTMALLTRRKAVAGGLASLAVSRTTPRRAGGAQAVPRPCAQALRGLAGGPA